MLQKTIVVAGGGVVGLSVARTAARQGLQVLLLEKNALIGMETSSRNSEVVHAGIYYAKDSWKAKLCVRGKEMLYRFCDDYNVPYRKCGKLIVAQEHQTDQLRAIGKRGFDNHVIDLRFISKAEAKAIEPQAECHEALYSPSTGIIDSHSYMLALQGDAEAHGAAVALSTAVQGVKYDSQRNTFTIEAAQNGSVYQLDCDYFVNATGMFAPLLQHKITVTGQKEKPNTGALPNVPKHFAKGTYFKLTGKNSRPFSHLVYPIPEIGGLGVHSTVDMEGNVKFGPDVEWIDTIDYMPDQSKAQHFADKIRLYWPGVDAENLVADYCGIRPKIEIGNQIYEDFYIAVRDAHAEKLAHQLYGLVHLCGIESPGLTSSLAIAEVVVGMLKGT